MSSSGGGLRSAHSGYIYQDLAAAYVLVEALVEQIDRVVVDRKIVEDDRIDDLEVVIASRRVRRQIKWSGNPERCLIEGDFLGVRSSLRIDELVMTRVSAGNSPAEEYRLCATWSPPPTDDPLARYIRKVNVEPTILGSKTQTFCLDAQAVWPVGTAPNWNLLATENRLQRDDFVSFCEVFVIELEMPQASLDLTNPGPMEAALVEALVRRVGVGTYPNGGMRPEDVATRAVFLATTSRSRGAELTRSDIVTKLKLRTDYGHVAQAYPLDRAVMVSRPESLEKIVQTALEGGLQIVTAPPGAGKSWEITQIADDLHEHGAIVARHYCYFDPSDDQSALRITSNAFFGNLIYELIREAPELGKKAHLGLAADFDALERLLSHAPECDRPLVLIVDGLDHIERVRAEMSSVSREQSDIIDRLAALNLPSGVAVIVASQPGEHLEPLRTAWETRAVLHELPPWSRVDLIALTCAHGVNEALRILGIAQGEIEATLERLAERADGNPLYARALSVEICTGAKAGDIGNPLNWLSSTEDRGGGLSVYYRHLYESVARNAHVIADVLGVIDFAVTQHDVEEMVGPLSRGHVASAIRVLRPVLVDVSTQGGLRVFHESFRRFIREQLVAQSRSIADVLAPILTWLQARDFFADALSFRFLVPALARAGRDLEVWSYIDRAFVRKAVAHGHALDPILANITVAAEVARRNADWSMLVRCMELRRAALTTFDSSQDTWETYIEGYLDLFGANALAERLLFDGRPTLGRNLGLFACTLIDQNGGVPPWREYLDLPREATNSQGSLYDRDAVLDESEKLQLNVFRALLHLRSLRAVFFRYYRRVRKRGGNIKPLLLRSFACTVAEVLGIREASTFFEAVVSHKRCALPGTVRCLFLLGVAEAARKTEDLDITRTLSMRAVALAPDVETLLLCLEQGAPLPETLPQYTGLEGIPIGVWSDASVFEAEPVRQWVAGVRLQARRSRGDDAVLERERNRVVGVGWYRLWLEFIIDTAILEAHGEEDDQGVVTAFRHLERNTRPFHGWVIGPICNIIEESINRGLSLLRTREGWSSVLSILSRVAHETQYSFRGEDYGAIPTGTFVRLLLPHVANEVWGDVVLRALEARIAAHNTTFYPTLAEFAIGLARGRRIVGDDEGARSSWLDAATYLTGYGWHKDPTVYELLKSL